MKSLTFNVLDDGTLDVHYQLAEGQPIYSFDPAQLPDHLGKLLPKALTAALAAKTTAEAKATEATARAAEAEAKVEEVAGLIAVKEQLAAKDAIIQDLMAQVAGPEAAAK